MENVVIFINGFKATISFRPLYFFAIKTKIIKCYLYIALAVASGD
jgi:hypothetical protein